MKNALVAALLVITAIPLLIGVAALPPYGRDDTPVHTHVSARYLERGAKEAGSTNIVTAVLLNYRGLDTAGEVTVIFTALAAVLAVLITYGVSTKAGKHSEVPKWKSEDEESGERPLKPSVPVSPVSLFVVRLLAPFIAIFAVYVTTGGHVTPGGGFQGAAVFGALFITLAVVLGERHMRPLLLPKLMPWLQGMSVLAFVAVGVVGAVLTGFFLGYPVEAELCLVRKLMITVLEIGIGLGGAAIFATLFLQMETD